MNRTLADELRVTEADRMRVNAIRFRADGMMGSFKQKPDGVPETFLKPPLAQPSCHPNKFIENIEEKSDVNELGKPILIAFNPHVSPAYHSEELSQSPCKLHERNHGLNAWCIQNYLGDLQTISFDEIKVMRELYLLHRDMGFPDD